MAIRDYNIANDAQIQLHKIMGGAGLFCTGEIFWVGTSGDSSYNAMRSRIPADHLFTSIDTAVGSCVANRGDVIAVMEGHSEAVAAAAGLDLDVAGITVVFLGSGTSKANITFGTATTADMDVDAADITLVNPKFVAAIDALAGPIDVNSTDFTIINGEYHDATDINTIDCVIATSGATRMKIKGWKFFRANEGGTQKQSNIQLNGVDDAVLEDIDIRGDFATGNIENVTDEVLNIRLKNVYLDNLNATPKPGIVLDSNADGHAENVHIRVASGTTYVSDLSDINWASNCLGYNADGGGGEPIGTAIATGVEGKIDIIDAFHDVATADATTNTVMSDVIGNKTDAAANAVATTKTIVAYAKGIVNEITVPAADNTANGFINDVIGNKEDAAATGAVTTTDTLVGYVKQLVTELGVVDEFHDVPAADNVLNAQMNEVIGNKEDAAATGAVTTTDTLVGYTKQLVTELQVIDAFHDVATADATTNAVMSDVIGNKEDAAVTSAGTTKSAVAYLKGLLNLMAVGEATGEADIDISEADYTAYTNILTVTAPATGLSNCQIDIDVNKATTGWDTVSTAADTIDISLVGQVDGTNYRTLSNATQITANGDGTLENNESGVSFNTGPLGPNKSVQVHVKLSVERADAELPYRVSYVGAAPTITPVAAA